MDNKLLDYFNGDELAASVWKSKYAQQGEVTPDDMHKRMAKEFARIETLYQRDENALGSRNKKHEAELFLSKYGGKRKDLTEKSIYNLFKDFKYIIPQGSIMSQLGSKSIGSLSNCFVLGQPEDSYGGIFEKDEEIAQVEKRRGGAGLDISSLRPENTPTSNAAKSSTGAVSFMHRFSNTTREVAQNGRRGALMLTMDINHPDILEFIKIKRDLTKVTGANISIKLNDEFMQAVENDENYILRFPCDINPKLDSNISMALLEPNVLHKGALGYYKVIKAKEYWEEIIKSAHGSAEPGLLFWDNMINYSPDGVYPQYRAITTNPCSEIGMQAHDACRLIALNLYSFVLNPFTNKASFDFNKFYEVNYEAMRLSDDLVDLELQSINRILDKINLDPESAKVKSTEYELWKKIRRTAASSRRTGLGFTGLGDTLAALGFAYDSEEALLITDAIMDCKMESELDCTIDLAILRGTFTDWDKNKEFQVKMDSRGKPVYGKNTYYQFVLEHYPEQAERMYKYGRRNVSISTVAPTGSLSMLAQLSSGMEPAFLMHYKRRKKINPSEEHLPDFIDDNGDAWQEYNVFHHKFVDWYFTKMYTNDRDMGMLTSCTDEDLEYYVSQSPWAGSTAPEIDWIKRVEMQSVIQRYISHSISSTINLPSDVSLEEVSDIYMASWKKGLKGITVYRDGSRSGVLVSKDEKNNTSGFEQRDAFRRPGKLEAHAHKSTSKGIHYHVLVGLYDDKPYEIFIDDSENKYSSEGVIVKEAKGKYIFKNGGEPVEIRNFMTPEQQAITRLVSMGLRHGTEIQYVVEQLQKIDGDMFTFAKSLARVLKKYIPDGTKSSATCNDCKSDNVIFEEGCHKCLDCGSSKCG